MIWTYRSRDFAIKAHKGQRYGEFPYEVHLDHVVQVLIRFGLADDAHIVDAAFLHDTVEDTDVTVEDLTKKFSTVTAQIVDAVSDGPGKGREAKKERPYFFIPRVPGALQVKLADRIANVEACWAQDKKKLWEKYKGEYPRFFEKLHSEKSPKPIQHMWAYLQSLSRGY